MPSIWENHLEAADGVTLPEQPLELNVLSEAAPTVEVEAMQSAAVLQQSDQVMLAVRLAQCLSLEQVAAAAPSFHVVQSAMVSYVPGLDLALTFDTDWTCARNRDAQARLLEMGAALRSPAPSGLDGSHLLLGLKTCECLGDASCPPQNAAATRCHFQCVPASP